MFPPPQGFFPPFGGGPPPAFPSLSGQPSVTKQDFPKEGQPPQRDFPDKRRGDQNSSWKTKVCFNWQNTGHCKVGDKCKYHHGPDDMRPGPGPGLTGYGPRPESHNRRFSDDKPDFMDEQRSHSNQRGCSPFDRPGDRPGFQVGDQAQSFDERANKDKFYKTRVCKQFMETGQCGYGDRCTYAHGEHELRPGYIGDKPGAGRGAGPNPGASFHGPGGSMGPGMGRGAGQGGDMVGPIRGPGVGPNPNAGRGAGGGPGLGNVGGPAPGPGLGPAANQMNRVGANPGGPPAGEHQAHMDGFRPGSGWMGPRSGKLGQGPMPPGGPQIPPGGPPLPMPPSHQGPSMPSGPNHTSMSLGAMPGRGGPTPGPKAGEVTFVDRVRAVCGLLNIGNSQAAAEEKPHAVQAAVAAIHNRSVFRENPFADSVEQYL